jgi:hypothetical protein
MASGYLACLATSNSRTRTMENLLKQEREARQKAETEARTSQRIEEMTLALSKTTQIVDALDTAVGKMVVVLQRGGHFQTTSDGSAETISPGAVTVRYGERRPTVIPPATPKHEVAETAHPI